jgi:hypothetical protein
VSVRWRVNGGAVNTGPTTEWNQGALYGAEGERYYHEVRGQVSGTSPGDSVEVWFTAGAETSPSFTYQAVSESGGREYFDGHEARVQRPRVRPV